MTIDKKNITEIGKVVYFLAVASSRLITSSRGDPAVAVLVPGSLLNFHLAPVQLIMYLQHGFSQHLISLFGLS